MKDLFQFNEPLKQPRFKPSVSLDHRSGIAAIKQSPSHSKDLILVSLFKDYNHLPLKALFAEAKRVLRHDGNLIIVGTEPVLSRFRIYGKKYYRHEYTYPIHKSLLEPHKKNGPVPSHVSVAVFQFSHDSFYRPMLSPRFPHKDPVISPHNPIWEPDYHGDWPTSTLYIYRFKEFEDERIYNPMVDLYRFLYETYSKPGSSILSLSAISAEGVAAVKTARNYTGCIYHEHDYLIARQRLEWAKKHLHIH